MENKDIIKKLENIEETLASKFAVWEKTLNEIKKDQSSSVNSAYDNLFYQKLVIAPLNICIHNDLYNSLMEEEGTYFPSVLAELRAKLLEDKGYIIPPFEVNPIGSLEKNSYLIFIRNELVFKGYIEPKNLKPDKEIAARLEDLLFIHADKIMTREVIWNFIKILEESDILIAQELMKKGLSIGAIRKTFVNLLKERISIKDIRLIFQQILEMPLINSSPDYISEKLRQVLKYSINNKYLINNEKLNIVILSNELENDIVSAIDKKNSYQLDILGQMIYDSLIDLEDVDFILMVNPRIRLSIYRLLYKYNQTIKVIATTELNDDLNIDIIANIDLMKTYELDEIDFFEDEKMADNLINFSEDFIDFENN